MGLETKGDGTVKPFAESFACKIYSDEQKAKFLAYRQRQDPDGLFATGLGMNGLLAEVRGVRAHRGW